MFQENHQPDSVHQVKVSRPFSLEISMGSSGWKDGSQALIGDAEPGMAWRSVGRSEGELMWILWLSNVNSMIFYGLCLFSNFCLVFIVGKQALSASWSYRKNTWGPQLVESRRCGHGPVAIWSKSTVDHSLKLVLLISHLLLTCQIGNQLIGFREKLQENPIFHRQIYGFL